MFEVNAGEWIALAGCTLTALATMGSVAFGYGRISAQIAETQKDVDDIKRKVFNGMSDKLNQLAEDVAEIRGELRIGSTK